MTLRVEPVSLTALCLLAVLLGFVINDHIEDPMVKHGGGYKRKEDIAATLGEYVSALNRGAIVAADNIERANPELASELARIKEELRARPE